MRKILEKPKDLTQGTIFSNAKSCHFSNDVHGLIISNRCDIENSHYDTLWINTSLKKRYKRVIFYRVYLKI